MSTIPFSQKLDLIFSKHLDELPAGAELYHYTSLDAVINIISTNKLWLSHSGFCNDLYEINYGLQQMGEAAKNGENRLISKLFEPSSVRELILYRYQPYIFCLSRHRDHLPQWQAYAERNGCCITFGEGIGGIHVDAPMIGGATSGRPGLRPVIYEPDRQAECAKELYDEISKEADRLTITGVHDLINNEFGIPILNVLLRCAVLFKNPSFRHEGECRLINFVNVIDPSSFQEDPSDSSTTLADVSPHSPIRYRSTGRFAKPYVESVLSLNERLPIREIMIGPSDDQDRLRVSLEHLTKMKGYPNVPITVSEIPLSPA